MHIEPQQIETTHSMQVVVHFFVFILPNRGFVKLFYEHVDSFVDVGMIRDVSQPIFNTFFCEDFRFKVCR